MNKGLEALEKGFWKLTHKGNIDYYNIIETELKRLESLEHWNEVCEDKIATLETTNKRQREILRIIKEKDINFWALKNCGDLEHYNEVADEELTQAEFDLLKGWLK